MKKTFAIITTILVSLLCGLPGIILAGMGLLAFSGALLFPELVDTNQGTQQEVLLGSLVLIVPGIILILIPIVVGILTLRKRKPSVEWAGGTPPVVMEGNIGGTSSMVMESKTGETIQVPEIDNVRTAMWGPQMENSAALTDLEISPILGQGARYRFSAHVVDFMIWGTLMFFFIVFVAANDSITLPFPKEYLSFLWPILVFLYYFLLEGSTGSTFGKRLYGLTVIDIRGDGGKCTWLQAAIRTILLPFEMLLIGAIVISVTPRKQRIADLIAGTLVVRKDFIQKVTFKPPLITFVTQSRDQCEFEVLGGELKWVKGKIWLFLNMRQGDKTNVFRLPSYSLYPEVGKFNVLCERIKRLYSVEIRGA